MGTAIVVVIMVMGCLQLPVKLLSEEIIDGAEHEQLTILTGEDQFGGHLNGNNQFPTQVRQNIAC